MLVWRTTSLQVRGDDAISFLGVCPCFHDEMLWDEVWQSASDKGVQHWLEETVRDKVCCVHYTLSSCSTTFWSIR